jgi:hypothetical protein
VNQAIATCGGDAREPVNALIVASQFLETDLEKLRVGYRPAFRVGHCRVVRLMSNAKF